MPYVAQKRLIFQYEFISLFQVSNVYKNRLCTKIIKNGMFPKNYNVLVIQLFFYYDYKQII